MNNTITLLSTGFNSLGQPVKTISLEYPNLTGGEPVVHIVRDMLTDPEDIAREEAEFHARNSANDTMSTKLSTPHEQQEVLNFIDDVDTARFQEQNFGHYTAQDYNRYGQY